MTWQEYQTGMWTDGDGIGRWHITQKGHDSFAVHEKVDRHTLTLRQKNLASLDAAIEWIGGKDD